MAALSVLSVDQQGKLVMFAKLLIKLPTKLPTKLRVIPALLLMALVATACGGDGDDSPAPLEATVPPATATETPRFPPTWTPTSTDTPSPLVSPAFTAAYQPPPTGSPVFMPTRPPTEIPPTPDPLAETAQAAAAIAPGGAASSTTVLLSQRLLNDEVAVVLEAVVGSLIGEAPEVSFESDLLIVAMSVPSSEGSGSRPVTIEADMVPAEDQIRLVKQEATYADTATPYTDPIADFVLGSVDTALNTLLLERYQLSNPGGGSFVVVGVDVSNGGLTIQTDAQP